MKNKSKQKSLRSLYGDFIYYKPSMKKSQDQLISKANVSIRQAYSDMENLVAKTYFLAEQNCATRSELKTIKSFSNKLMMIVNDYKYKMMR